MPTVSPANVPAHVVRDITGFARALVASVRAQRLYSADHPAASAALGRLSSACTAIACHRDLNLGVAPGALLANGEELPADRRSSEAATLLHDHDILRLRVVAEPTRSELFDFLQLLAFDANAVRERGGPAALWRGPGHASIEFDQIDYDAILAAGDGRSAAGAAGPQPLPLAGKKAAQQRDDIWHSLVRSLTGEAPSFDQSLRERLRHISQSADDVFALTTAALRATPATGGAALEAAQAATVLTAFGRLAEQMEAIAPEQVGDTIRNIAAAASRLDHDLLIRILGESAESGLAGDVTRALGAYFDDEQVARLLARSMASEGRATARIAGALHTLAPDPERQTRVLRLARTLDRTSSPGGASELESAWQSLEQMMDGPADTLYTSSDYAYQLQQADLRSQRLRLQAPEHLDAWMESVSAESIRTLSVSLLLDLFTNEVSPVAVAETAHDLAALAEDLLSTSDFRETDRILRALAPGVAFPDPRRAEAARQALDRIAGSKAISELSALAGDFDAGQFDLFQQWCHLFGTPVIDTLLPVLVAAHDGPGRDRLLSIIAAFGDAASKPLAAMLGSEAWAECRTAIQGLGRVGGPAAAAALQPLLYHDDPHRVREAAITLVRFDAPEAHRYVSDPLKTGAPAIRSTIIEALAACRDARAATILAGALHDTRPFGRDYRVALHMLSALRRIGDVQAVPAAGAMLEASSWRHPVQTMRIKQAAIGVLATAGGPQASQILNAAASKGDGLTRRYARAACRAGG